MLGKYLVLGVSLGAFALLGQQNQAATTTVGNRIVLGRLANGATVVLSAPAPAIGASKSPAATLHE